MSFPTVQTTNTGVTDSSAGTSHTVNLPTGIQSGDLLLIYSASQATPGTVTATGWTFLATDVNSGNASVALGYRTADGTEGSTVAVTSSSSARCVFVSYRITGWSGTPEKGTAATGVSSTADPPNLTPSWGAADTLWLAACATKSGTVPSAAPANYSNLLTGAAGSTIAGGISERQLNASSENPGTFTNNNVSWIAQTYAVKPVLVQTLTPSLYTNSQSFYTEQLNLKLTASLFSNTQTFYTPLVHSTITLTPSLFIDGDTFYSSTVHTTYGLTSSLYSDSDAFYVPTVTRGAVNLSPNLYSDADTFYSETVHTLNTLIPTLYLDVDTFYSALVQQAGGSQTVLPSLYVDTDTFYTEVVGKGPVTLFPSYMTKLSYVALVRQI